MKKRTVTIVLLFSLFLGLFTPVGGVVAEAPLADDENITNIENTIETNDTQEGSLQTEGADLYSPPAAETEGAVAPPTSGDTTGIPMEKTSEPAGGTTGITKAKTSEPTGGTTGTGKGTRSGPIVFGGTDNEQEENDLNVFLDISPASESFLSGEKVYYKLTVKFTGSKRTHKDVELTVEVPQMDHISFDSSASALASLAIDGVIPTFDNHKLTYSFAEIERGQTYEKIIPINTENGYIPNGTKIPITATLTGETHLTKNDVGEEGTNPDETFEESFSLTDTAEATIKAGANAVITKSASNNLPMPEDEVIWTVQVSIPKEDKGQMYLDSNANRKITIYDYLPSELAYVEMVEGPTPTYNTSSNLLTWNLNYPSLPEQEAAGDTLFIQTLKIKTMVKADAETKKNVTNKAEVWATFIDGSRPVKGTKREVYIVGPEEELYTSIGTIMIPAHFGPNGPNGEYGGGYNPRPTVTDDAYLRFAFTVNTLPYSLKGTTTDDKMIFGDYLKYDVIYDIDLNLRLEKFVTPKDIMFRPTYPYHTDNPNDRLPGVPFDTPPTFAIWGTVDGVDRILKELDLVEYDTTYTREDLGLTENEQLTQIKLVFGYAPGGLGTDIGSLFRAFFTVTPGYVGTVENKYNITGTNWNDVDFDFREDFPDEFGDATTSGPRQAYIIQHENLTPTAEVGVELLDHSSGIVTAGGNRMRVTLSNVDNSPAPMHKPLETVVLLPPGVTLATDPDPSYAKYNRATALYEDVSTGSTYVILDDDYNETGRQLIRINWNDVERIVRGESVIGDLNVIIDDMAPSQLWFDVYGYSGDATLQVPNYTGDDYTNTVLQTDMDEDLNEDDDPDAIRLKSANKYTLIGDYDLQTEKIIKGPCDEDYSKFTLASPGEEVAYKLKLTNTTGKDISFMTLIDVFPSVGDLGITDGIGRGSKFSLNLKGPITISEEWQRKVAVYYSTATNPKRDDLTRNVNYPAETDDSAKLGNPAGAQDPSWIAEADTTSWVEEQWSTINSFKVELINDGTDNAIWIKGEEIEIDFTMLLPSESELTEEVLDCSTVPQQRAAWNSFAASTEQGQVVEPERVGVAIRCPGSVELKKVDEEGNALTGAEFSLYKEKITIEIDENGDETEVLAYVCIRTGLKVDENGILKVEGLGYGNYYFLETKAPVGYLLSDTKINFTIATEDYVDCEFKTVELEKVNYKEPLIEKDVEGETEYEVNRDEVYDYNISVTMPGDIEKYVKLTVIDTLDDRLQYVYADGDLNSGWQVSGLDETDILFELNGQELKWSVSENGLKKLAAEDRLLFTFQSKIKLDAELSPMETGIPNTAILEFDNNQGGISDPDNPPETPPVIVIPEAGGLKVNKVDKDDHAIKLVGAEFKLTNDKAGHNVIDATGTIIQVNDADYQGLLKDLATGSDGTFTVTGLTPGIYYLHETKTPSYKDSDGNDVHYKLLREPVEVEVINDIVFEMTVENEHQKWSLPQTGGKGIIGFLLLGGVLIMIMIILSYLFRTNRFRYKY